MQQTLEKPITQTKPPLFTNKDLQRLLIPLLIEQTLAVAVGMADTVMVSAAGEAAVSGVSLVDSISNLIINLLAALTTGGAVVISQLLGAKDRDQAKRAAGQLFGLSGLVGLVLGGVALAFARPILSVVYSGLEPSVMDNALVYLRISALSYPFLAVYNSGAALFRSQGNSRVSMKVSIVMNIVNVSGNAICIYGLHMGVAGVAIPTLISRALAACMILYRAADPHGALPIELKNCLRLSKSIVSRILNIGVPSAFENSLFQVGRVLMASIIAGFGTTQIAANAVANNLSGLGVLTGQATCLAMIAVVGRCVGAKDNEAVVFYTKKLLKFAYLVGGATNLAIVLLRGPLMGFYPALSTESLTLAGQLVLMHAGYAIVMWPTSFVLPNALRAANDVRFTMVVSIASMFCFRILFSYLLGVHLQMGAVGVWLSMLIDWTVRSAIFGLRFKSGAWKTKRFS